MLVDDATHLFVQPVPGTDDTLAFRYDFLLEGKAVDGEPAETVTELDNGDLLIEGYAAVFDGIDREGENFVPGAFQRGIKAFLDNGGPLCFHHKTDHVLGKVLDLREEEGKGLWMQARVDAQPESSPLRWIYNAIKRRSMRGLSVGGYFKRKLTEAGQRIADMDFTEISTTGVPIHPGASFSVVAGKALSDITFPAKPSLDDGEEIRADDERRIVDLINELGFLFERIKLRGQGPSPADAVPLL